MATSWHGGWRDDKGNFLWKDNENQERTGRKLWDLAETMDNATFFKGTSRTKFGLWARQWRCVQVRVTVAFPVGKKEKGQDTKIHKAADFWRQMQSAELGLGETER